MRIEGKSQWICLSVESTPSTRMKMKERWYSYPCSSVDEDSCCDIRTTSVVDMVPFVLTNTGTRIQAHTFTRNHHRATEWNWKNCHCTDLVYANWNIDCIIRADLAFGWVFFFPVQCATVLAPVKAKLALPCLLRLTCYVCLLHNLPSSNIQVGKNVFESPRMMFC